jgi:8-hydroxy-5-deazaflavin:NADPH oxidoreductase
MKCGVLGSGIVAQTLSQGFKKHGHEVMTGTRDPGKLQAWSEEHRIPVGSYSDCAAFGEIVLLAVKGTAAKEVLSLATAENLHGKIVVDATNPIADAAPEEGVLRFFTSPNESLMEDLQASFTQAKFVKAFNSTGALNFIDPSYREGKPTMFICGNDKSAKSTVAGLLADLGWDTADMGRVQAARAIEPLCMLWCIPGFLSNQWTHAFKLLRRAGVSD